MSSRLAQFTLPARKPGLVIFDLDYTLWPLWIDTHSAGGPYTHDSSGNFVFDRRGGTLSLFPDVVGVFSYIRDTLKAPIAIASRTSTPQRAREVLNLLRLDDGTRIADALTHPQIYPGSKLQHMRALHRETGIAYEDMLFFDDESRNSEVEKLGVTFVLVDEEEGVSENAFCEGLEAFGRKRHEAKLKADDQDTHGKRPPRRKGW